MGQGLLLPPALERRISTKKLVLAGDYFSSLASVQSSSTGVLEVPYLMCKVMEEYCAIFFTRQKHLRTIQREGYQGVNLAEILDLHLRESTPILHILEATSAILGRPHDQDLSMLLALLINYYKHLFRVSKAVRLFRPLPHEDYRLALLPYMHGRAS
jgi:hypothetical protein